MTPHRQSFDSVLAQLVAVHHHEVQALRRQLDQVILPEATGCSDVAEEAVGEALLSRPSFCRAQSKLGFADPWGPRSEQEPAVLPCGEITIEALETDESVHSVRSDLAEETGNNDETMRAPAQESRVARLKQALQQNVEQVGLKRKSRKRILALSRSLTIETEGKSEMSLKRIVQHPVFDSFAAVMIILNSFLMAWEAETLTISLTTPDVLSNLMLACNVYFIFEVILRLLGLRRRFFTEESRSWNLFDLALAALSLIDMLLLYNDEQVRATNVVAGVKTLKMLRIIRVFRVFRFSSALARVALMIVDSMKSLLWALIMLAIVVYVFAISLTTGATDWSKAVVGVDNPAWLELVEASADPTLVQMHKRFGSLAKTAYTLVQAMLGGISWGEVSDLLMEIDVISPALLLLYVAFTMLAVLNVITGAFVDNALQLASQQRDFQIEEQMETKEEYIRQIKALFKTIDDDGSGEVSRSELREMLEDATLAAYFRVLGFDTNDADMLFDLLDTDESDSISMQEFLDGCTRLKGSARSMDVHAVLAECRRIRRTLGRSSHRYSVLETPNDC